MRSPIEKTLLVMDALLHSMEVTLCGKTYRLNFNNCLTVKMYTWLNGRSPLDNKLYDGIKWCEAGDDLQMIIHLAGQATPEEIEVISANVSLNKAKGNW